MSRRDSSGDWFLLALMAAGVGAWLYYFSGWFSDSGGSSEDMSGSGMLDRLARAVYGFEDPNKNQVATRNNNPGNLKPPDGKANFWQGQTGVDDRGFAIFDSMDNGFRALKMQFSLHPDWSLQQFFAHYLNGKTGATQTTKEGNPLTYAAKVAAAVGASVSSKIGDLLRG